MSAANTALLQRSSVRARQGEPKDREVIFISYRSFVVGMDGLEFLQETLGIIRVFRELFFDQESQKREQRRISAPFLVTQYYCTL